MNTLAIDMMGSDLGSKMSVEAVLRFHKEHPEFHLLCFGKAEELNALSGQEGIEVIVTTEVMEMTDGALEALRKKDSSMVKAIEAVREGRASGVVSAGGTGAFLSASSLLLKKAPGVLRPALVASFPNFKTGGHMAILDVGASNENTAEEIAQFAIMGSLYAEIVENVVNPKVSLLANGSEEGKGSPNGKKAYEILKTKKEVNFLGNIEASNVLNGDSDVIVTDGYSGNVLLKATEGAAKTVGKLLKKVFLKNLRSKIAYLFVKGGMRDFKASFDSRKTGGALLLGTNGVVVKAHGNSDAEAFYNALLLAARLVEGEVVTKISKRLQDANNA